MPTEFKKPDYEHLFDSLSAAYIVVAADDPTFTIVAENDEHARIALVEKGAVIGQPLLQAFPDTSEKFVKTGVSDLLTSIRRVIRTGTPDTMPLLHYDLQNAAGDWETKYWRVSHHPVFSKKGTVAYVFQATREVTGEVMADERRQHAEEQFQLASENGLISVWRWDIKQGKVFADANLCKLFGLSKNDGERGLSLERFIESIHPEDRQRVQDDISRAVQDKLPYEAEYRTLTKQGIQYVIARGVVEVDEQGEPDNFPGIVVDISDRKKIELELQDSEKRLRFMANSMPQLVWITRPDGYHEYYNQRWYEYTGTKPGTTDGDGWNNLFHPQDQARARKRWQASLKSGNPYEIEYRLYNAATDSYRWVIGRAMPYRDTDGTILKWYGTCTDIHDVKMAEENIRFLSEATSLLASSLDYKKTFKRIAQLIVPELADWCTVDILDEHGALQQVALAHKDPNKVKWAKELRELQGPPDMSLPTGLPNVIRTGKPEMYAVITDDLLKASAKNKEEYKLLQSLGMSSAMVVPIIVDGKGVGGMTLIAAENQRHYTDADLKMASELAARSSVAIKNATLYADAQFEIAARKKLEEALKSANEQLEERVKERTSQLQTTNLNLERSNRELEDFAYVASHDLQEPLRKIQAFGDLLIDEYGETLGEGSDYLRRMQGAAGRMSNLINDLLTFSRVSTKKAPKTEINLKVIIDDVIGDLEDRIEKTAGTVTVSKLPEVYADPMQMRQLFQNLIANSLKFHRDKVSPVISITAKEYEDSKTKRKYDEIQVKDNGVGFDEKYLDRIFAVFQRLHGRDSFEGTGIGLAVCRKIIERHNGTITATSQPGQGATFIIRLPKRVRKGDEHGR